MPPKRLLWSQKNMDAAIYAVKRDILSVSAAADIYRIPKRTLRDHVKRSLARSPLRRHRGSVPADDDSEEMDETNNNNTNSEFDNEQSWYCHACRVDKVADMRQCGKCLKWYHEVCVGLTLTDIDPFECPIGC